MITVETINQNYLDKTGQKAPSWLTSKWEWQDIVWKKVERTVFNLQKRIYKATKTGHLYHAIWLKKRIEKRRKKAIEKAKVKKLKALEKAKRRYNRPVKGGADKGRMGGAG